MPDTVSNHKGEIGLRALVVAKLLPDAGHITHVPPLKQSKRTVKHGADSMAPKKRFAVKRYWNRYIIGNTVRYRLFPEGHLACHGDNGCSACLSHS